MALHRDIYWVGRQWAVTAVGIQAVDQRRRREFDIEVARVWDDGLVERMLTLDWFNREDFDKALAIARARFPEPPRKPLPLVESILELIQSAPSPPVQSAPRLSEPAPAKPPEPAPPIPQLRTEGALARFLPQWRVRR
jgi:hypothetical protein